MMNNAPVRVAIATCAADHDPVSLPSHAPFDVIHDLKHADGVAGLIVWGHSISTVAQVEKSYFGVFPCRHDATLYELVNRIFFTAFPRSILVCLW